ncbi:MAG: amidase [Myxococcales bacterium]|nr:amidase [Myxococcales bacterium]
MSDREILAATALEQAKWVRTRQLSAEELTRLYLRRIAAHDGRYTAFVELLARSALCTARRIDRRRGHAGPFAGVPIGIKDLNLVRGSFTRFGSRALAWVWTPFDDRVTARIRAGGFVILGKLATSELGALPVTEPPIHAPTRNPWDTARTPGGSSGGSAAAVAAGLLPIAQGSDGAGSIRIPSAFCHLFGFKPSRGLVPDAYGRDEPRSLSVSGPLAHGVDDAAALLDVMAAPPRSGVPGRRPFAEQAREPKKRLRVRVVLESPLCQPEPEMRAAVLRTAKELEALGHDVEEGLPPVGTLAEFLPLWQWLVGSVPVPSRRLLGPVPRWLSSARPSLERAAVEARHDELDRRLRTWFGDADLWLSPTVGVTPPLIGSLERPEPADTFAAAAALGAFTALFNVTGQPAATVPAGLTAAGHPIGVQLAGRRDADGEVLAVARQLEAVMPWRGRRAPGWPGAASEECDGIDGARRIDLEARRG